jgi:hypothetical protein
LKWLLVIIAAVLEVQSIELDTRAMGATLKAARAEEKGFPQYPSIRKAFLAWQQIGWLGQGDIEKGVGWVFSPFFKRWLGPPSAILKRKRKTPSFKVAVRSSEPYSR